LAQWAVGDLSGRRGVEDIQPHTTLHRGFVASMPNEESYVGVPSGNMCGSEHARHFHAHRARLRKRYQIAMMMMMKMMPVCPTWAVGALFKDARCIPINRVCIHQTLASGSQVSYRWVNISTMRAATQNQYSGLETDNDAGQYEKA
jgi:hypothetical protein